MSKYGKYLRRTTVGYLHWCPACEEVHSYRTEGEHPPARWNFNGDLEKPSFTPSMKITWGRHAAPDWKDDEGGICHYYITAGQIQYCSDCTHSMAGQTVALPEWPKAPGTYGGIEE